MGGQNRPQVEPRWVQDGVRTLISSKSGVFQKALKNLWKINIFDVLQDAK